MRFRIEIVLEGTEALLKVNPMPLYTSTRPELDARAELLRILRAAGYELRDDALHDINGDKVGRVLFIVGEN